MTTFPSPGTAPVSGPAPEPAPASETTGESLHPLLETKEPNSSDPPPPDPPSPPPQYGTTTANHLEKNRALQQYQDKEILKYRQWMEQSNGNYAQDLASLPLNKIKVHAKSIGVDVPDTPESTQEEEDTKKQELLRLIGEKRIQNFEEWASTVSGTAPVSGPAPAAGTTE